MKFAALLKKDLKDIGGWTIAAFIITVVIFALAAWQEMVELGYKFDLDSPDYYFGQLVHSPLTVAARWIPFISITLCLILAIVQFYAPFFARTWAYTIHRSVKPETIVFSRILAAVISLFVGIGIPYSILFVYASFQTAYPFPPSIRVLTDGLLILFLAMIIYAGMALTAVNKRKWYTTKALPLILSAFLYGIALTYQTPVTSLATAAVFFALLLSQIVGTFCNREF